MIGIDDPNIIYIIDFGLCKKYRSSKTGKHILPGLTKRFNGTISYVSPNVFKGKEASRRDDLISLGYMLLYLIRKSIPKFPFFKDLNRQQYYEILSFKESYDEGKLFKGLPQEINEYIKYTKNLKFEQDPDYSFLRSLFTKMLSRISLDYRNIKFSWIDPSKKELIGMTRKNSSRRRSPLSKLYKRMIDKMITKRNLKSTKYNINNINNLSKSNQPNNIAVFNSFCANNNINNLESMSNDKNNLIINENNQFNIIIPVNNIESYKYKNYSSNNVVDHVSNMTIGNTTQNYGKNRMNPLNYISEKTNLKYIGIFNKNNIEKNNQINPNKNFEIQKNIEINSIIYKKQLTSKNGIHFRKINPIINKMNNNINNTLKIEKIQKTNEHFANNIQTLRNVNRMNKIKEIIHLKNNFLNKENTKRKIYNNKTMKKIKDDINEKYFADFVRNNHINYSNNLSKNNSNHNYYNSEMSYNK